VFLGGSSALFLRAHSAAQAGWILCFVLGVGSMLFTSAAYHRINWSPQARRRWRRADHFAIFLAITGTYLAIIGLTMHGVIRTVVLLIFGVGTVAGILIRQLTLDTQNWVNTMPYLVMGWAAVAVMPQIYRGGGAACLWLIVSGGVAYSLGALFLGVKRPKLWPRTFGHHELFHAFTIVGAGCHFAAVYLALR
jgi:hemolysin III